MDHSVMICILYISTYIYIYTQEHHNQHVLASEQSTECRSPIWIGPEALLQLFHLRTYEALYPEPCTQVEDRGIGQGLESLRKEPRKGRSFRVQLLPNRWINSCSSLEPCSEALA